ncbi:hypothetical protein GPECTOR_10g960 [Gonium pectorale]|uniref:Uncharacterized protein n=1 Tax=Gonium pectorale TaxID=33097 RepID=A0A150GRG5_GONPE|nr:hypothetical protein GPECTOR_10g960 [Gonium pectorale]|eukprot:KXZ52328.1 hypothetical protein GPECTOR_10g960 [Gonium pectorale]
MAAIRELLENGVDPNIRDGAPNQGKTPLMHAVTWDNPELIGALLGAGASVCAVNEAGGLSPLHYARSATAVGLLVRAGAPVDAKDERGNTPLHLAAGKGQFEVVSVLLRAGASENRRNADGKRPSDLSYSSFLDDILL